MIRPRIVTAMKVARRLARQWAPTCFFFVMGPPSGERITTSSGEQILALASPTILEMALLQTK